MFRQIALLCRLVSMLAIFASSHPVSAGEAASQADIALLRSKCQTAIALGGPVYSAGEGHIRMDYTTLCLGKGVAVLFFEAAAMGEYFVRGPTEAPWVNLEIIDKQGSQLRAINSVVVASVADCAKYQFYAVRVPMADIQDRIGSFKASMGGTRPQSCAKNQYSRESILKGVAQAIRAARDCKSAGLTGDEETVCETLKIVFAN